MNDPLEWAKSVARIADQHKGEHIIVLDMREVTLVADYFVIITGHNLIQVDALANYVEEGLAKGGVKMLTRVGRNQAQWVLLDYGSVVVHVFTEDARSYYDLERLWGDAGIVAWNQ